MKTSDWDLLLFVLASPILVVRAVARFARRCGVLRKAVQPALTCRTCGNEMPLTGIFKCRCGYTYQGHLLRYCPNCGSFPSMVRCYHCGVTEVIPKCD